MAAPLLGTSTTGNNTDFTHVVNAGSNLVLAVLIGTHQGTITNVTYGGIAMTQIAVGASANNENGYVFLLLNPTVGSATVAITRSGGSWHGAVAQNISGAKQTTTVVNASAGGSSSDATVSLTSNSTPNVFLASVGTEAVPTAVQTNIASLQGQSFENSGSEYFTQLVGDIKTMNFSLNSSQRWGIAAMVIEAAPTSGFSIALV